MALDTEWRKSGKSSLDGSCVQVRRVHLGVDGDEVQVRDSKNPTGPVLGFTAKEWDAFVDGAKGGEFDL